MRKYIDMENCGTPKIAQNRICSHLHINLTFTNIALQGAGGGNGE
jgi:hypothetical protein